MKASANSRALRVVANATMLYPLLVVGLMYCEWLLACRVLGRQPVPMDDDPKFIDGSSWMHDITGFALVSVVPLAGAALCANIIHIILNRPSAVQAGIRLQTMLAVWLGAYYLSTTQSFGQIVEWWFD